MQWSQLKRVGDAPQTGMLLAYTRKKVIYEMYSSLLEAETMIGEQDVLELHLFDNQVEYRALACQSPRFPEHFIENVFSGKEKGEDCIYSQRVILGQKGRIQVNNYISYNENGMAVINNYQLVKEV